MKLLGRICAVSLLLYAAYYLFSFARTAEGRIEYEGRLYPSIEAARHAAGSQVVAGDIPFYCGNRLTILALILGFYIPQDPIVCFTSEGESDQLYTENRALELRYKRFAERFLPPAAFVILVIASAALFRKSRKPKR